MPSPASIITIINIVAGIVIGTTMMNMSAGQAVATFSILTIGDGLVSQIPSLLIAIGSGMLVTKSRSEDNIGTELPRQFLLQPKALLISGGLVPALALVPGMPTVPFGIIALAILGLYFAVRNQDSRTAEATALAEAGAEEPEERIEDLIGGDRMGIEIGYRLILLVDKEPAAPSLDRITALHQTTGTQRRPADSADPHQRQHPTATKHVQHLGLWPELANAELHADRLLAIDGGGSRSVAGTATREPAFGLDAVWIDNNRRSEAEAPGYAVTDPASAFVPI